MTFGPVQMLVLEFDGNRFSGEILPELRRLREHDIVRLVDLAFVRKSEAGEVDMLQLSDLNEEEAKTFGAYAGALLGLGMAGEEGSYRGAFAGAAELEDGHVFAEADVWYVGDALADGSSAAVVLLEHRWAVPLRDAIGRAGGVALADAWIHPADLIAVGLEAASRHETASQPA
jgi:uncharacterized membrane protein